MRRFGSVNGGRKRARYLAAAALVVSVAMGSAIPEAAHAQQGRAQATYDFDLPAQPLARSVSEVASRAGLQVLFDGTDETEVRVGALKGRMTAEQALARILAGSGFTYQYVRPGVITLKRVSAEAIGGERVTSAVKVEGLQGSPYFGGAGVAAGVNGVNGSRDITATEGTGSFTSGALTIGSKVPQAMKDVPQSISVLTAERLEQQNVTDFTSAMRQLPGITLVQGGSSLENQFYSRGFAVTSIQVDGGAPLSTSFGVYSQIDMSIYDHVELLRGAAALFNGYGTPSGTVNLVRKKPLDHAQVVVEGQIGSWSNYRVVADATSPLALDGKLRGRLVLTYQDNRHFYDTARDNKTLIYGIGELDVTPTTLLTAGISFTRQDSVPWYNGLPRYLNGDDLKLPRSTSFVFPWNRWDFDTTEIFGSLEKKIGGEWTAKLDLTRNRQSSTQKLGYSLGAVNPTNGLGPHLRGIYTDFASTQLSAEATLTGAFTLFGQRQEVTIGANRVDTDGGGRVDYQNPINIAAPGYQPYPGGPIFCRGVTCPPGSIATRPPINVFDFDASDPLYTEPRNSLPSTRYTESGWVQSGAYINLRLTTFDRLHLTTGLRWSRYQFKNAYESLCTSTTEACAGKAIGDVDSTASQPFSDEDFSWPPPVNLSFDITKSLTAYAGYTDIHESQAYYLDASNNPLPPITGSNWEAGVKWTARDGRLNLSVAAYRIRQKGFGNFDPDHPFEEVRPGVYCCFIADPNRTNESKGIDAEATGEIRPGWQVAASYTFNKNEQKGSSFGSSEGLPFISIQPRHLYKLWMSYDFNAAGHDGRLAGLTLSGGVNGQSSAYRSGAVCVNFVGDPDPVTGAQSCASFSPPDYVPFEFTVPAYALLSARVDYRFSDTWSMAVNFENILDKTYYQTTGGIENSNWYGAPRSFIATVRAKW